MAPRALAAAVVVVRLLLPSSALLAYSSGITGFSGQQGAICNSCHGGGVAPTVAFLGPTTLAPGDTGTYTFMVHSNAAPRVAAGIDISASDGTLQVVSGQDEQLFDNELTHVAPQPSDVNGNAVWAFTWQAPAVPGDYTLFGAGNSVNLNSASTGDRAAATLLSVSVVSAPPATPTATATPTPAPCTGDCNDDRAVTVDEVVTVVSIALGASDLSACVAADTNDDGAITIDEILAAVSNALNGCSP